MLLLYLIGMILVTIIIASIIPVTQYLIYSHQFKAESVASYSFTKELYDHNLDDVESDKLDISFVGRVDLANRGWVRSHPNGTIMTRNEFEEKKRKEYAIELP